MLESKTVQPVAACPKQHLPAICVIARCQEPLESTTQQKFGRTATGAGLEFEVVGSESTNTCLATGDSMQS
jgi:hypothetical protein